eukprot:m.28310 g.28310  ORF g.28310 m.28310 type:complete len:461 (+) comp15898_c0_seq1:249-1631(+)
MRPTMKYICSIMFLAMMVNVATSSLRPCPRENRGLKSKNSNEGGQVNFVLKSRVPFDAFVFWVNFAGEEAAPDVLSQGEAFVGKTFAGHAFRVRSYHDVLLGEYVVPEGGGTQDVRSCGNTNAEEELLFTDEQEKEFAALVHDQNAPCVGSSGNWSCIRVLTDEEYRNRNPNEYGFIKGENSREPVGFQLDESYTSQIPSIPRVSADGGPGFLKMTIPAGLRIKLLEWYESHRNQLTSHESVTGYTNNDLIPMHKLNLDHYPQMRALIVKEMLPVLQWWCKMKLRHTSTYGVRVYHRDSMLINHVDRMESHLASAVVQVSQDVDRDGGWPLEVLLPDRKVGEVYLKPGEMVLYEGAWLRHGRPMRLKGDNFANFFTHYSPIHWRGPKPMPAPQDQPLPYQYHGYMPGRCSTIADVEGMKGRCVVTEAMAATENYHLHDALDDDLNKFGEPIDVGHDDVDM